MKMLKSIGSCRMYTVDINQFQFFNLLHIKLKWIIAKNVWHVKSKIHAIHHHRCLKCINVSYKLSIQITKTNIGTLIMLCIVSIFTRIGHKKHYFNMFMALNYH